MRSLLSIWSWAWVSIITIVGFVIHLISFVLTRPFDRDQRLTGRLFRLGSVVSAKLNPLWQFRIDGTPPSGSPGKTIVISNHRSQADIFLISHLPWEMKWMSKAAIFKIPFLGWSMRLAGDIPVARGDKDSRRNAMKLCGQYLARGMPIMIFPEGTRSKTGEMLPFKDGAFKLAIEHGAALLPVAVAGTSTALPKHEWRFGRARAVVTVGEPIPTEGLTVDDLDDLKATAHDRIATMLGRINPMTTDADLHG